MKLTDAQRAVLDGAEGEVKAKVMLTLVKFGEIFGAEKMVPVTHACGHLVTSFGIGLLKPLFMTMDELIDAGLKAEGGFTVDPRPLDYENVKCNPLLKLVFNKFMYSEQARYEEQLLKAGLVDRDAWSARTRDAYEGKLRNLYFLPRYCIENYLIDVNILEEIFGSRGCGQELSQALRTIRAQIPGAVRHGSLWRAVQPLYDELMGLGFNGALLRFDVPSDSEIFEVLKSWDRLLDARRIYADYRAFEEKGSAMPVDEALRVWIHGKVFWRKSVAPALQEALGGMGEERLQRMIYPAMPLPTDVELLLKGLLALEKSP